MKLRILALALLSGIAIALPARAALILSEVLANEVGSDTAGEFFEIFNNGLTSIDLTNYKIGDEETSGGTGTGEAMHLFPPGATIGPGQLQIVAASASVFQTNYGFLPTYELDSTVPSVPDLATYSAWDPDGGVGAMANGDDHAIILDPSDARVDAVSWGNNNAFNPGIDVTTATLDGQSFERINVYVDTDTRDDWKRGPGTSPAATRSTPGVANVPEPATAALAVGALFLLGAIRRRF